MDLIRHNLPGCRVTTMSNDSGLPRDPFGEGETETQDEREARMAEFDKEGRLIMCPFCKIRVATEITPRALSRWNPYPEDIYSCAACLHKAREIAEEEYRYIREMDSEWTDEDDYPEQD